MLLLLVMAMAVDRVGDTAARHLQQQQWAQQQQQLEEVQCLSQQ